MQCEKTGLAIDSSEEHTGGTDLTQFQTAVSSFQKASKYPCKASNATIFWLLLGDLRHCIYERKALEPL